MSETSDIQPNVGYYNDMKASHWDPLFSEQTQSLGYRLISVNRCLTGLHGDHWNFSYLVLVPKIQTILAHMGINQVPQDTIYQVTVPLIPSMPGSMNSVMPRLPLLMPILRPSCLSPVTHSTMFSVFSMHDEAKTRFACQECGRQWTSMKGSIKFLVVISEFKGGFLSFSGVPIVPGANVFFELFPQSCKECNDIGKEIICQPKWYPEEITKVIKNLFVKVYLNFYNGLIEWDTKFDYSRRHGKPSKRHDSEKCTACHEGICRGNNPQK